MNKASLKRQNSAKEMPPTDFIPLTSNSPNNFRANGGNHTRKSSGFASHNENNQTPRASFSGGKEFYHVLNNRVYEMLNEKPFSSVDSIVKNLKLIYPRDYLRIRDGVLKTSVQKSVDKISKQLQKENSSEDEEQVMDVEAVETERNNNLVNNTLNCLYQSKSQPENDQTNQGKGKERKSKGHRESVKVKKARLEEDGQEKTADHAIDETLAKQVKLRERYLINPKVTFSDFGGIQDVIVELKRLLYHIRNANLYRQLGVEPPRGFLLNGPPGVGKSLLVEALANDLKVPCLRCGATEIIAGISGESEEKIRELFSLAKSLRPCLLFIDEIDAITPKRENAAREMERRIVTQLITSLDQLSDSDGSGNGVMVIGATNRADALDPALRRAGRFDREISLGMPDEMARLDILRVLCRKIQLEDGFDFESLAHKTPGFVGADLKSLIREAAVSALERHMLLNNPNALLLESPFMEELSGSSKEENLTNERPPVPNEAQNMETLQEQMNTVELSPSFRIEFKDFEVAFKQVQPSSKREGFATVPDVTWDDIGALSDVRQSLQLSILAPIRYSRDVQRLGLTLSAGILLCGPPGCGKTLLAKAIANESGINFISVKGPELLNMYVGESERAVRSVFTRARNSKPCVIFFDEIDALCPKRNDGESSNVTSRVVNQLLTEMDGLESRNCFMLAATNRPDIVDPAILRPGRFEKTLYVGFPSSDDRYEILWKLTKNGTKPPIAPDVDFKLLAQDARLEDFTGADLSQIIREASLAALRERIEGKVPAEKEIILHTSHFELALQKVRPSVSKVDREHYHRMMGTRSQRNASDTTK